ncbi:hypothetical protein F5B20DRAFT_594230 [Whalleya microplaca]|nr:hypothetical protein F5B20DRAFT_594230 [Whalleya microplaca]
MLGSISILSVIVTVFSAQAMGKDCHLHTTVSHRQNSACGAGSCIAGDTFIGSGVLKIDGKVKWNKGGNWDKLSNGKGVDVDSNGVKFHIDALGVPNLDKKPKCAVHIGDYTNLGIGKTKDIGLPGVVGTDFDCDHDWKC